MYSYIIKGGKKLHGEVAISGSKNSSLPILAATIISGKTTKLYNLPDIEDVKTTLKILEELGCKVKKDKNKIIINSKEIDNTIIPDELMRKLRSSVIIAGALIARFKKAQFSYPGGCDIGSRPIDLHLENFKKIGIKINESCRYIECKCDKIESKNIELDFPSVGTTENLILAAIIGDHEITINNAAREPEIIDLSNFLNRMGAKINIEGKTAIIKGVRKLYGTNVKATDLRGGAALVLAGIMAKGTTTEYPTLQQDDIVNNATGIYQMEFARFIASGSGITGFTDKRTFIDFTTIFENINTQVQALIEELEEQIQEAGNLPIDENEYNSNDSDGNTFNIKFRRQGSIVSLHITATLLSGAFGQRIAGQLGFTDGTVPEKYRPREIIRSKENYAINSGASMQILAYLSVLANTNNSFVIQYNNIDTQTQYLEINLMYFGKEV